MYEVSQSVTQGYSAQPSMKQLLNSVTGHEMLLPAAAAAYLPPYAPKGSYYHQPSSQMESDSGGCLGNRYPQLQPPTQDNLTGVLHHQGASHHNPAGDHPGLQQQQQQRCPVDPDRSGMTEAAAAAAYASSSVHLPLHLQSPTGFSPPSTPLFQSQKTSLNISAFRGSIAGDGYAPRMSDFAGLGSANGPSAYDGVGLGGSGLQAPYHGQQQSNSFLQTAGCSAFQKLSPWSTQSPCGPYFSIDPCKLTSVFIMPHNALHAIFE